MKKHAFWKRILTLLLGLMLLPFWQGTARAEEDKGLLDAAALDAWMDGYVQEHKVNGSYQRFSVGFCYTATGESWYYDADQWMYSASMYKVPVAMLIAEKEAAGELTQDSNVLGMPLSYWESTALTYSNNDSGHAMVDYLGGTYLGKCSDMTIRFTDLPEDYFDEDFYQSSYYTARYMTQVMKTLYDGGEESFPHVIEYLLPAQPDGYLNRSLKDRFQVAQKYGAYEEPNGNKNNHVSGIVYTPTPIIVTVMTRNVEEYQDRIAEVGEYLADYALELDARAEAMEAERQAALAAAAATPTPEETEESASAQASENPSASGEHTAEQASAEEPARNARSGSRRWLLPAGVAAVLVLLIVVLLTSRERARRRKARERAQARQLRQQREEAAESRYSPRH